jgi:hypothetical protein
MDFLRGMGKAGPKFVLVLDINKVLASDDRNVTVGFTNQSADGPIGKDSDHPARARVD